MYSFNVRKSDPHLRENWSTAFYLNANDAWQNVFYGLNVAGIESSPRGLKIREVIGADFIITDPRQNLVHNTFKTASPYYIAQEYFWYHSGSRKVDDIGKYSKFWYKIADDNGMINSNYGAYIFDKDYFPINGMSQWEYLVDTLKKDPDSRQAILQIPITPFKGTKDVCCTSSLQFFIRNNKLYMITYMRSNDIVLGFRNDIPFFTSLQIDLANELGVELGYYRHMVGSLHVYENNFIENSDKKFMYEYIEFIINDSDDISKEDKDIDDALFNHTIDDYKILARREKEGLSNPILKYMADNFDNK